VKKKEKEMSDRWKQEGNRISCGYVWGMESHSGMPGFDLNQYF